MDIGEIFQLIFTILGDGVLLFVFHQFYASKVKTVEKNNDYKEEVLKDFLSRLQEYYKSCLNIQLIDQTLTEQEYSFYEVWNPISEKHFDLGVFANTHPIAINQESLNFNNCLTIMEEIGKILLYQRENNNDMMSEETVIKFGELFNKLVQSIIECMGKCEEEILNLSYKVN